VAINCGRGCADTGRDSGLVWQVLWGAVTKLKVVRRGCLLGLAGTAAVLAGIGAGPAQASTGPVFAAVGFSNGSSVLIAGTFGGSAHRIFRGDQPASVSEPAVSPDGRRIAFVEIEGTNGPWVSVINTDGSGHRHLTGSLGSNRDVSTPVWSRDGKKIFVGVLNETQRANYAAYVVSTSGSGRLTGVSHGSNARPESISSDNKTLAFDTMLSGDRWQRTALMTVSGTSRHLVGGANLWQATWKPRSSTVAVSRVLRDTGSGVTIQIQLLNTSTGHYHALAATQSATSLGAAYPLAWNSTGTWLYYLHYDYRNGDQVHPRIYRIRADGSGRTDVTPRLSGWTGPFAIQGR